MTAAQKLITELETRLTATGMTVYIVDIENKNSTTQLINRLTTDGFDVVKVTSVADLLGDRGVLIFNSQIWDLRKMNIGAKLRTAQNIKYILFIGDVAEEKHWKDWIRVKHVKLDDIRQDGKKERIHLDIWKRIKVEI